ncbi:MAG: TilS substrate-binding domain-containing protein [Rhodopseudomonas palustris]|nr:TilS substrate-binding domain-containing protein [Rhodopseudomonas palustris]
MTLLDEARARNLLRYWLRRQGMTMPGAAMLCELRRQLATAKRDSRLRVVVGERAVRCHRGWACVEPDRSRVPFPSARDWSGQASVPWGDGKVVFRADHGRGDRRALAAPRHCHAARAQRRRAHAAASDGTASQPEEPAAGGRHSVRGGGRRCRCCGAVRIWPGCRGSGLPPSFAAPPARRDCSRTGNRASACRRAVAPVPPPTSRRSSRRCARDALPPCASRCRAGRRSPC